MCKMCLNSNTDKNGNGNENNINQQNDLIAINDKEHLNNAMSEAYNYMVKYITKSVEIKQCDDSNIFFEIRLEYIIAITSTILEILYHKFNKFHIYGMRGSEDSKDVIFECRVN